LWKKYLQNKRSCRRGLLSRTPTLSVLGQKKIHVPGKRQRDRLKKENLSQKRPPLSGNKRREEHVEKGKRKVQVGYYSDYEGAAQISELNSGAGKAAVGGQHGTPHNSGPAPLEAESKATFNFKSWGRLGQKLRREGGEPSKVRMGELGKSKSRK